MHRRGDARLTSPRVMCSDIGPDTLARADGIDVSLPEFRLYRRHAWEMLGLEEQSEAARGRLRLDIGLVEELIDRALLVAAGRERRVPIPPDELELRHHIWLERLGGPTEAAVSIGSFGLTPKQFRDLVRRELLAWRVRSLLTAHVAVSDRQVQQFFKRERCNPAHASLFVDPVRAEVAHVLIEAQPRTISARLEEQGLRDDELDASSSELVERRRALAETIRDAAAAGTSFVALAAAFSEDALPQENGGSLAVITPGTCAEPLERVVFSLRVGEVGPVVHTAGGLPHRQSARAPAGARADTRGSAFRHSHSAAVKEARGGARPMARRPASRGADHRQPDAVPLAVEWWSAISVVSSPGSGPRSGNNAEIAEEQRERHWIRLSLL